MALDYKFLTDRGALNEVSASIDPATGRLLPPSAHELRAVAPEVVQLIPRSLARDNLIMPVAFDGETITVAAVDAQNIALADKLRFILARNVRFIPASRQSILAAINRYYDESEGESVDGMLAEFTDTAIDFSTSSTGRKETTVARARSKPKSPGGYLAEFKKGIKGLADEERDWELPGEDNTLALGGTGMFFYVVEEGQRVLMRRANGTMEVLVGPRRVWRGWNTFQPMRHFVATPGKFLIVRFRNRRPDSSRNYPTLSSSYEKAALRRFLHGRPRHPDSPVATRKGNWEGNWGNCSTALARSTSPRSV
jgi:hypothetical protein